MDSAHHLTGFIHLDIRHSSFTTSHPHPRCDSRSQTSHSSPYTHIRRFEPPSPASTEFHYSIAQSPHGSHGVPEFIHTSYPTPHTGMIVPAHHRGSVGSMTSQPFVHRSGSLAGSDRWSPHSNHTQGPNHSDESLSQNGWKGMSDIKKAEMEGKLPAWSELKTKAGKERKRLPLACIVCRRKKIRCSGEKPACKHCLRARIPCVYKVTTRKAAPRTDYMAMLDRRLRRMEERVIKVTPKEELPDLGTTGRSAVRPPIPGTAKAQRFTPSKKRSADEAFVQELAEWTEGKKPVGMPDAQARLRKQVEGENRLFTEGASDLPPPAIQEHLAEVFFDCVYGQSYLLLHKPSFMRKLKSGAVPPVLILAVCAISSRFSTHPQINSEPACLRGEQWATPARKIVEKRHYEPNITILTVMLILGLHYFGTCEGGLSWSFGGQAMRMAYALQLHRELDHDPLGRQNDKNAERPPELSFTDREIRRRTMWASFLMDTFNSSGTGRPAFGNEDYMQIQLPIKEAYFQMEVPGATEDLEGHVPNAMTPGNGLPSDPKENMGVAAYVIRAVILWRRIVKYLNLGGKEKDPHSLWDPLSTFADLRRQIKRFKESLPADLVYSLDNLETHSAERVSNQFLYLHLIITQCTLFLNRFAVPTSPLARPPKDMPQQFLNDASQQVVEAANKISQLIDASAGHNLHAPFAGYCAYAASTVQVYGLFSKNTALEHSSKENLRHNYKYLDRMKKYWGIFHYMAEGVKEIYRHFADAAMNANRRRNMDQTSSTLTPDASRQGTPMFQYGDWFDKYPHGVNEAEWEKGHHEYKKEQGAEAVMSQGSDLQSVEEFFASLSPPSKADDATYGQRGKSLQGASRKVARRRGKSVAESQNQPVDIDDSVANMNIDIGGINNPHLQSLAQQQQQQQEQQATPNYLPNQAQSYSNQQMMDTSTPSDMYQNPYDTTTYNPSYFDLSAFQNPSFASHFPDIVNLSQLDRQIVFGAYAGLDASTAIAANMNQNNNARSSLNQNHLNNNVALSNANASAIANLWDHAGLDIGSAGGGAASHHTPSGTITTPGGGGPGGLSTGDGFLGSANTIPFSNDNSLGRAGSGSSHHQNMNDMNNMHMNNMSMGMGMSMGMQSAWFMPFNIEPPVFTAGGPIDANDGTSVDLDLDGSSARQQNNTGRGGSGQGLGGAQGRKPSSGAAGGGGAGGAGNTGGFVMGDFDGGGISQRVGKEASRLRRESELEGFARGSDVDVDDGGAGEAEEWEVRQQKRES